MANAHKFKLALTRTIHVGLLVQFRGGFVRSFLGDLSMTIVDDVRAHRTPV
jgi:hypothetical protein